MSEENGRHVNVTTPFPVDLMGPYSGKTCLVVNGERQILFDPA